MTSTPPGPNEPFGASRPPYPGALPPAPPPPAAGGHGAYPVDPGGYPQRPSAPEQPASIALAVKLMLVGAVISVASLIYSLTTVGGLKDDIGDQLMKDDPNVSQSMIDAVFGVTIVVAGLFGLVGALLWVWMAWKNGQGRGWARVVATVFAAFNLLGVLVTVGGGSAEPLSVVLTLVSVALAAWILVLLWRKESTQFYEGVAASRRMY